MTFESNFSLKSLNTFGIDVIAKKFAEINNLEEGLDLIHSQETQNHPLLILGGGSNILFTKDFDGLVLKNNIKSITLINEDSEHYFVKVGAGVNWHEFVMYCLDNDYAGIENLSLIPGNVGASPMQNIGAYGVEVKDVLHEVEAIHLKTGEQTKFSKTDCELSYRSSVFKTTLKGQFLICSVTYKLRKTPVFNTSYGAIQQELERISVNDLSIRAISQAVCNIRKSKLPDPSKIGNAGSFFKNPVVDQSIVQNLQGKYDNMPTYKVTDTRFKLAAGWLIEQCGWKGKRLGNYGVHDKQALVLVNHGNAKGNDIYQLSQDILESVQEKFGVLLEREVNII